MADERMQRLTGHLRSLDDFRRRALAEGDGRRAARAEQAIIGLEQETAALMADLTRDDPETEESGEEGARMARKHILAVNGDPDFLNILRSLLQDERFNVTTTNFVPRSYAQIAALAPALLIVDLVIGERAGWDLLERLHREAATQGIPLIAISQDAEELKRVRWDDDRFGARRVLERPLNLHHLLDTIAELIGAA